MTARSLIGILCAAVLAAACTAVRSEECNVTDDCWEGLVCVTNPVVCTTDPCNVPAASCERACDDETPCGPRDTCSTGTYAVRSVSDSEPVRVCIPPRTDGGT